MLDWIAKLPLWQAMIFLFFVVASRAQLTFWLGRLARQGLLKKKFISDAGKSTARTAIQKFGGAIIPLSFLTIGFQTAVQFTVGLLGWSWLRYSLFAIPGYLAWSFIYASGGLVLFRSISQGSIGLFALFIIIILIVLIAGKLFMNKIRKK